MFDGKEASETKDATETTAKKEKQQKRVKKSNRGQSCSLAPKNCTVNATDNWKSEDLCQACGIKHHRFKRCYFVQDKKDEKP